MKIQDLAVTLGGILKICLTIGLLISRYFNEFKMNETILNTLYNFDNDTELNQKKEDKTITNNDKLSRLSVIGQRKSKFLSELNIIGFEKKSKKNLTMKSLPKIDGNSGKYL